MHIALSIHRLVKSREYSLFGGDISRLVQDDDFQALANNAVLWHPFETPGSIPGTIANRQGFLEKFWPWFKGATRVLKVRPAWIH